MSAKMQHIMGKSMLIQEIQLYMMKIMLPF